MKHVCSGCIILLLIKATLAGETDQAATLDLHVKPQEHKAGRNERSRVSMPWEK